MEYELYHYGVPGMKWGVRRDARILANHHYNTEKERLKTKRAYGMITAEQYISGLNKASARRKQEFTETEDRFRNAKTEAERIKLSNDITKKAAVEVPNIGLKRGLATINQLSGAASIGSVGYAAATMALVNPAFGAAYLGAGVVAGAAEVGLRYLNRNILDSWS